MDREIDAIFQPELPVAWPRLGLGGTIKSVPEDFRVEEWRPVPPEGAGPHLVLRVEKRALTTDQAAHLLAQALGVPRDGVGYAGLKDRQGITIQDFSVPWAEGRGLPETLALPGDLRVLSLTRDRRKIRVGHLSGNHFRVRLRWPAGGEPQPRREAPVAERVALIAARGVPNWFGPQRFGRDGDNFAQGREMLLSPRGRRMDRHQRGLLLSAIRSELWNRVLHERLNRGVWDSLLPGDVAQLAGRSACFAVVDWHEESRRCALGEIHPTGPLFGAGLMRPTGEADALEQAVAAGEAELLAALERMGMEGARRALRVIPQNMTLTWEEGDAVLAFTLPRGCYATSVLREFAL
ncbi:MAG: tRNA pseudouridine(13) synthase TruD [Magnetococcus sp. WYHC-3]